MYFFSNCYWEPSMLFDNLNHAMQDEPARQLGNGKVLESSKLLVTLTAFEVRKP